MTTHDYNEIYMSMKAIKEMTSKDAELSYIDNTVCVYYVTLSALGEPQCVTPLLSTITASESGANPYVPRISRNNF